MNERGLKDIDWHGCKLHSPGWNDPNARALAFTLGAFDGSADLHVMMNMYWEQLDFDIPPIPTRQWYKVVDTNQDSPQDILEPGTEVRVVGGTCTVQGRSIVILISK